MAASSSSNQSDFEEVPESYYKKMDELFGPLNNPVPKKRSEDKKEAAGEKRKMSVEEKQKNEAAGAKRRMSVEETRGGAKQMKGSAAAAAAGGVEATEKEGVPVVQRSLETANIVSPAETLAPTPTPEATALLVPRLSVDSVLQQSFSNGCAIRTDSTTTPVPQVVHNYYGPGYTFNNNQKPDETREQRSEDQFFTILDVKVEQHEVTFIEAIVRLLGLVDIQISPADVKLIGVAHGMPPTNCKRFTTDFQLTADHSAAVTAVLESRQITETVNGETIEILRKVSYLEILERELLRMGLKVFSERLAPSVVHIDGKRVVYSSFEIPSKTISLSVSDMLNDDVFLAEVNNTLNRVARTSLVRFRK